MTALLSSCLGLLALTPMTPVLCASASMGLREKVTTGQPFDLEGEPGTRFEPLKPVKGALTRVGNFVNRRFRPKRAAAYTAMDTMLTANLHSSTSRSTYVRQGMGPSHWEEHLLPAERTFEHDLKTSWEDRLLPTLAGDISMTKAEPRAPIRVNSAHPSRDLKEIDWEDRVLYGLPQAAASHGHDLKEVGWEDRLLP